MVDLTGNNETEKGIKRLNASGPEKNNRGKLMLFGQFVGDWEIRECKSLNQDGSWDTMHGELHWGWILDGEAVQDVWVGVPDMGTTIRFYDSKKDIWYSTWISPTQGVIRVFTGRKVGDEIVLETTVSEDMSMKWIFFDIQQNSFRWRAERSLDAGKTWLKIEEMSIVRQN